MTLIFALAGHLRYGAVLGIICTYIALAFLVEFLRSLLNLPDWVVTFSIFHQYGSPITALHHNPANFVVIYSYGHS